MNNFKTLQWEERDDRTGIITINRPEKLNALNETVLNELKTLLTDLAKSKIRAIVITGAAEKAFVAGADIAAMSEMKAQQALSFGKLGHQVMTLIEALPFPVIAAVNGFALGGGCELALACDVIYASENALFGLPEVKLGLIPGFGGTQRLMRKVGQNLAKEMILLGRQLNSAEALQFGLVTKVAKGPEKVLDLALASLTKIQEHGPLAVTMAKQMMNQGAGLSLEQGLALETQGFAQLFQSQDAAHGMSSFLQKQKATFKGL